MWVVPLVRRESGHNKQGEADKDIRSQHVSELMMKSYFAKVSFKKDHYNIGDFVMQEYCCQRMERLTAKSQQPEDS